MRLQFQQLLPLLLLIPSVDPIAARTPSLPQMSKLTDGDSRIQIRANVVGEQYCFFGGEALARLQLNLSLEFRNLSGAQVKIDRVAIPGAVFVAKSSRDMIAKRYEPGSRMPETLGFADTAKWHVIGRTVRHGQSFKITTSEIWMRVAGDGQRQSALGVLPGLHFFEIPVTLDLSDGSEDTVTMTLWSIPAPFRVESDREIKQGCS
jgi:hypothetical protein